MGDTAGRRAASNALDGVMCPEFGHTRVRVRQKTGRAKPQNRTSLGIRTNRHASAHACIVRHRAKPHLRCVLLTHACSSLIDCLGFSSRLAPAPAPPLHALRSPTRAMHSAGRPCSRPAPACSATVPPGLFPSGTPAADHCAGLRLPSPQPFAASKTLQDCPGPGLQKRPCPNLAYRCRAAVPPPATSQHS